MFVSAIPLFSTFLRLIWHSIYLYFNLPPHTIPSTISIIIIIIKLTTFINSLFPHPSSVSTYIKLGKIRKEITLIVRSKENVPSFSSSSSSCSFPSSSYFSYFFSFLPVLIATFLPDLSLLHFFSPFHNKPNPLHFCSPSPPSTFLLLLSSMLLLQAQLRHSRDF